MNIAINFYSADYAKFVEERVEEVYRDTDAEYNGVRLLQGIAHDMTIRFYDYLVPNTISREDLLEDEDPVLVLLTRLMILLEKTYPTASVIGFYPVDLKGHVLGVIHVPNGQGFINATSINHLSGCAT
jgi:hypothetical protein